MFCFFLYKTPLGVHAFKKLHNQGSLKFKTVHLFHLVAPGSGLYFSYSYADE